MNNLACVCMFLKLLDKRQKKSRTDQTNGGECSLYAFVDNKGLLFSGLDYGGKECLTLYAISEGFNFHDASPKER